MAELLEQLASGDVYAEVHFFKGNAEFATPLPKVLDATHGTKNQCWQFFALPPDHKGGNKASNDSCKLGLELTEVFQK
jgi:hypothetical protein